MTNIAYDMAKHLNAAEQEFPMLTMFSDNLGAPANLFANKMPPIPDFAVAIQKYEGAEPEETFSNPLLIRHPRAQVMVRDMDNIVALDFAEEIMKFFSVVKDQVINGTKYARIKPVGEPFELGPDSKNRQQAVINFEVSFYDSVGS